MAVQPNHEMFARFPPHVLRGYAVLGDGHRGAVCGPNGDVVWMCAPHWDDDAVFSALLGGRGVYALSPMRPFVWGGHYENGTLIWRNRWVSTAGITECREALAFPGDPRRVVLLRRIEAVEAKTRFSVVLDVRGGFGRRSMRQLHRDEDGRWTARTGNLRLRWSGMPEAKEIDGELHAQFDVHAGHSHDLVLEVVDGALGDPVDPDTAWRSTEHAWAEAVPGLDNTVAPSDARHAYAVLRGMTMPGGGMAAAATMSLPERAEQGRNFDYRYSWIRDQSYAGIAAAAAGTYPLLDHAVSFVSARLLDDGDALRPAYSVTGETIPDEQRLTLPGYPGGQTVAKGNWVTRQFQLDAFGEALQLLAVAAEHDRLDQDGRQAMEVATHAIARQWKRPEAGIWELDDDWWTQSRLSCIAGLQTAAKISPSTGDAGDKLALADTILAETTKRCLHPDGYWQRSPHYTGVDASLLLPPVRGALPASDPRTVGTLSAVRDQLTEDGYVYRFPQEPRPLGEEEGAFLLCGFIMALAEWQQGAYVDAFRWFERNRSACGPPALLAEEYDVQQKQLRGNLPQAFVHAALLEAATRLTAGA